MYTGVWGLKKGGPLFRGADDFLKKVPRGGRYPAIARDNTTESQIYHSEHCMCTYVPLSSRTAGTHTLLRVDTLTLGQLTDYPHSAVRIADGFGQRR